MKKIILYISLALLVGTSVYAACTEGTEVTGKNGHVYCKSNISMNWYTAFAWCDAQGRTLATIRQLCDIDDTQRWDGLSGEGKCLNMVGGSYSGNQFVWSAIPYDSSSASHVHLSTGYVYRAANRIGASYPALCW